MLRKKISEYVIETLIKLSGFIVIAFVFLIFIFLLRDSLSLLRVYNIGQFLFGRNWQPVSDPPKFGMIPLLVGSVYVTVVAIIICVPIGVGTAMFIAEV